MTFVTDEENIRVYDPVSGLEMVKEGGGSDGTVRFIIRGDKGECFFSCHMEVRDSTEKEKATHPEGSRTVVWLIRNGRPEIPGYSVEDSKEIIRDAMLTYENLFRTVKRVDLTVVEFFGDNQ
jgi:hypothetical protein